MPQRIRAARRIALHWARMPKVSRHQRPPVSELFAPRACHSFNDSRAKLFWITRRKLFGPVGKE
jgi:hypothetical protein